MDQEVFGGYWKKVPLGLCRLCIHVLNHVIQLLLKFIACEVFNHLNLHHQVIIIKLALDCESKY